LYEFKLTELSQEGKENLLKLEKENLKYLLKIYSEKYPDVFHDMDSILKDLE